jgi:hypothetical protein
MKLKELLEVVPNDYEIGLANFDKNICANFYFKKEDAIMEFAQKAPMTPEEIENLNVIAIHPGAVAHLSDAGGEVFGDDTAELRIKTQLLIEIA